VRVFLRTHRARLDLHRVEQARFLVDTAAALDDLDLAARLIFNGLLDEAERVHVLQFAARAKMAEIARLAELLVLAGAADRYVHVGAQVALVHVAVTGAERDHNGADLLHIGGGLGGRAHVRLRHDFHQRDAGAVEVHIGRVRVHVVNRLAGILFEVQPLDPAREAVGLAAMGRLDIHLDLALADNRVGELADLIALRQVRVEIVLAVKPAVEIDLGLQAKARTHGLFHAFPVDHRQHARHRGIHQRDIAVRVGAEFGRGAREQLGIRGHLRVDLQPHDDFPVAGVAFEYVGCACGHRVPASSSRIISCLLPWRACNARAGHPSAP